MDALPEVPETLKKWIEQEVEYSFETVRYGRNLKQLWTEGSCAVRDALESASHLTAVQHPWSQQFIESIQSETCWSNGIPGYQGVANRCLMLAQMADSEFSGHAKQRIAIATLATNSRQALVYRPHIAPDWHVICIDWGLVCGMWGVATCISSLAPETPQEDGVPAFSFDGARLRSQILHRREEVGTFLSAVLFPLLVMGDEAPLPSSYLPAGWRPAIQSSVFNALMFGLVAHEYAHVARGHLSEGNVSVERRRQIEHEADALALVFALTNPWKHHGDSQMQPITTGVQCLLFAFFGMIDMGERILCDCGLRVPVQNEYPSAETRLTASQYVLDFALRIGDAEKKYLNVWRQGFSIIGDTLWEVTVPFVIAMAQKREQRISRNPIIEPRGCDQA